MDFREEIQEASYGDCDKLILDQTSFIEIHSDIIDELVATFNKKTWEVSFNLTFDEWWKERDSFFGFEVFESEYGLTPEKTEYIKKHLYHSLKSDARVKLQIQLERRARKRKAGLCGVVLPFKKLFATA
ncbi:hypothetical protein [Desulfolutivibrio sp.]|uniref:hypothetical protein n=1 Tax=Desulfolutivibrio sp. TaxID=2773296 RepID=UPI002F96A412